MRLLICALFFGILGLFMSAQAQDSAENENSEVSNETEAAPDPATQESTEQLTPDQKLLSQIEGNIASFNSSYEDSTALQNRKKKQFAKKLREINEQYAGKQLNFQKLCVVDVEPEIELSPYGRKQAKKIVSQLKRDPQTRMYIQALGEDLENNPGLQFLVGMALVTCEKCRRQTGHFQVTFDFSIPDESGSCNPSMGTGGRVSMTVPTEAAALRYVKGRVYPASGRVSYIKIEGSINTTVDTKIFLR